jgi:serine phosphatase RsbU (regulator of sigma subunit)
LRRQDGSVEELEAQAMVLGAFAKWDAAVGSVRLGSGDRLLVLSDGAAEAQKDVAEFGEERVRSLLESTALSSPQHALGTMEAAILDFSGGHLYDDCTMLLLVVR